MASLSSTGVLSSSGVGSGLDVAGLVNKLVTAERTPIETRLSTQETDLKAQLSGFGQISSALDKLKTALDAINAPTLLNSYQASSGDSTRFTATTTTGAVPGSYSVEVSSLAAAQKLTSGTFSGADAVVGTGTLTLTLGGKTATVVIDSSNNTLAGIRSAINAARDANGQPLGISASLITSTGGSEPAGTYLVLTSASTGTANTIGITQTGGDGGLAALQYQTGGTSNGLTETQPPADAVVTVDGFTYTSASNSISGALGGVTLNLVATTTAPVSLTVAADTTQVQPQLQALVDAYNGLFKVLDDQGGYNAASKTAGPLMGDPALRSLANQLRRALTDPVTGAVGAATTAADIGLSVDSHGVLSLDAGKLQSLLGSDPGALAGVLQGTAGVATRMSTLVSGYVSSGGLLASRTDSINHSLSDISDQRDALATRMDDLQNRYLRQFNALDGLLAQMQSTGNFLTQQLAALPGAKSSVK